MRPITLLPTAVLLAILAVPVVAADEPDDALRKATMTWLKDNVTDKADNSVVDALTKPVTEFTKGGHNFTILMGSSMTKSGKAVMVCGWAGELFPFTLSEGQAKSVALKPLGLTANANRRSGKFAEKASVALSDFKITDADSLDGGKLIKGSVKVKVLRPLKDAESLWFRLDLKFPEFTRTKFFILKAVPEDGATVALTFSEINPPGGKATPFHGPVGVFLNLVDGPRDDVSKVTVVSNTLGTLLDVE